MELLQLKYFLTVAKMESVTRAAAHHRIPQPAMSQTIARLEKALGGVRLFDRKNNRIYLNENGRLFQSYVENALLELENGVQAMRSKGENVSGSIRILALEGRRFCFDCVSHFAEAYPHISFSISHDYSGESGSEYDLCISTVSRWCWRCTKPSRWPISLPFAFPICGMKNSSPCRPAPRSMP